jgi:hypothetical protein
MKVIEDTKSQYFVFFLAFLVVCLTTGIHMNSYIFFGSFFSDLAFELMSLFLLMGFIGFILRNNSLILINFLACISICTYLKNYPDNICASFSSDNVEITVAHLVLSDSESISDFEKNYTFINADFLSIQTPLLPTLDQKLTAKLSESLPFCCKTLPNKDLNLFVFSAYELINIDRLYSPDENTVSLVGNMIVDSFHKNISFLSTPVSPDIDFEQNANSQQHTLSSFIDNSKGSPMLTLFSADFLSNPENLSSFKSKYSLNDSQSIKNVASDKHIFYSSDLICTGFSSVLNGKCVIATYKFNHSALITSKKYETSGSFAEGAL